MYEDWVTKAEAAEQTGMSERTLERMILKKKIRQAYRNVPGRRAIAVLHPDDVGKLKAAVVPAQAEPVNGALAPHRVTALLDAMMKPNGAQQATPKRFLTLEEAASYVGLPAGYLKGLIKSGQLSAVRYRGIYIRRSDLDQL